MRSSGVERIWRPVLMVEASDGFREKGGSNLTLRTSDLSSTSRDDSPSRRCRRRPRGVGHPGNMGGQHWEALKSRPGK